MGFIKNLVTFGASGRIERKIEEFNQWKEEYEELYEEMERKRNKFRIGRGRYFKG
ncbi:MAG: hypothetical protein M3000_01175 [Bacillus wiedmannii]|nr:hypothetical protein [Bacillus wiedmannii]